PSTVMSRVSAPFRISTPSAIAFTSLFQSPRQRDDGMKRRTPGGMRDLLPARGACCQHQVLGAACAHVREEGELADLQRELVVLPLVAERARHAAASRRDLFDSPPRYHPERRDGASGAEDRLLVAVAVQQHASLA